MVWSTLLARKAESSAFVARTTQVPEELKFAVTTPVLELTLHGPGPTRLYVTAPLPDPPETLRVAVADRASSVAGDTKLRVD
jgi:hypothetical protein